MDVARPYRAIAPTLDGDILVELSRTTKPRTGRELARLTGRSEAGIRRRLERLVEQGVVEVDGTPAGHLYILNREHLAAPLVGQLARLRLELFERLRARIAGWRLLPVHASVFGSTARADGDTDSDIDIVIVRPQGTDPEDETWRKQMDDLAESIRRWTGNHAGLTDLGEAELPRLRRDRPLVVTELMDHAIHLHGTEARRLFGAQR